MAAIYSSNLVRQPKTSQLLPVKSSKIETPLFNRSNLFFSLSLNLCCASDAFALPSFEGRHVLVSALYFECFFFFVFLDVET
jgi:hypothetical protein